MKKKDIVAALRTEAERCRKIGHDQYDASVNQASECGFTNFTNARIWGDRAQGYLRAAIFVSQMKEDT